MLHWNHPLGLDCTSERPASYPGLLRPRDRATDAHFIPANDDHPLGTLGGSWSDSYSINEKGQVIGGSYTPGDSAWHTFLYSDGTMTDLTQMVFDLFLVDNFSGYDIRGGQIIGSCDWGGNMNACILTVPNK